MFFLDCIFLLLFFPLGLGIGSEILKNLSQVCLSDKQRALRTCDSSSLAGLAFLLAAIKFLLEHYIGLAYLSCYKR